MNNNSAFAALGNRTASHQKEAYFGDTLNALKGGMKNVTNAASKNFGQMRDDVYNKGRSAVQNTVQGAQNMGRSAMAGASNAVDRGIDNTLNAVNNNLSKPIYGAIGAAQRTAAALPGAAAQLKDDAYNAGAAGVQGAQQMAQQGFQATKDFGNQAVQGAQNLSNQAVQGAQQMGNDAYNAGAAGVQQAQQMGQQGIQGAQNMGRSAMAGASNAVDRGIDNTLNAVNNNLSRPIYGTAGAIGRGAQNMFQAGMDQHGNAFAKSGNAFDALGMEKAALAQVIAKGLRFAGQKLVGSGARAGSAALQNTKNNLNIGRMGPSTDAQRNALATAMNAGKGRAGVGNAMGAAGKKIQESPMLKNTINATGLAGLVGAGAAASNLGDDYGSQSANANSPMGLGQYTGMGIQIPRSDSPAPTEAKIPKAIPVNDPNPEFAEEYRNASPADKERMRQGGSSATAKEAPDYNAQFRKQHGGTFDPNSRVDRQKMQAMQQKSAFETLGMEKEAIAGSISKLLGMGGKALSRSGQSAKAVAGMKSLGNSPPGLITQEAADAAKKLYSTGDRRLGFGRALTDAADEINATPWIRNTINAGGLTAGGVGAYSLGSNRGERRGVGKGLTEGIGIGAAHAYKPDPGVLGRLGQLFTGTPEADMSALDAWLNENKDEVIKKILSRKP